MVVININPANAGNINVKWALRMEHSSNRFSVSMKQNTREFSLLSLCLCVLSSVCLPHRPPCVRTHREAIWEERVLTRTSPCWCPDLGLLAPRAVRKLISGVYSTESIIFSYGIPGWQIQFHLFWKFKKENEWKEIEKFIALLRNLWDFTKLILFSISPSYELTTSLPRECVIAAFLFKG